MAQTEIDTNALRLGAKGYSGVSSHFAGASDVIGSVASKLDWEFDGARKVEAILRRVASTLREIADKTKRHSHYLEFVADTWDRTEAGLMEAAGKFGGGAGRAAIDQVIEVTDSEIDHILGDIGDALKDAFSNRWDQVFAPENIGAGLLGVMNVAGDVAYAVEPTLTGTGKFLKGQALNLAREAWEGSPRQTSRMFRQFLKANQGADDLLRWGKIAKWGGTALAAIGGVIDGVTEYGDSRRAGDSTERSVSNGFVEGLASFGGAVAGGALAGAAMGTIFPGPGNLVGAIAGAAVGVVAGIAGSGLAKAAVNYDGSLVGGRSIKDRVGDTVESVVDDISSVSAGVRSLVGGDVQTASSRIFEGTTGLLTNPLTGGGLIASQVNGLVISAGGIGR